MTEKNAHLKSQINLAEIPIEISVELGSTVVSFQDLENLSINTTIQLDALAGELLRIYANGKHIANGECIVINEYFGVRVTGLVEDAELSPFEKLKRRVNSAKRKAGK